MSERTSASFGFAACLGAVRAVSVLMTGEWRRGNGGCWDAEARAPSQVKGGPQAFWFAFRCPCVSAWVSRTRLSSEWIRYQVATDHPAALCAGVGKVVEAAEISCSRRRCHLLHMILPASCLAVPASRTTGGTQTVRLRHDDDSHGNWLSHTSRLAQVLWCNRAWDDTFYVLFLDTHGRPLGTWLSVPCEERA